MFTNDLRKSLDRPLIKSRKKKLKRDPWGDTGIDFLNFKNSPLATDFMELLESEILMIVCTRLKMP